MKELVVDTNVLVQAGAPDDKFHRDSQSFAKALLSSTVSLAVDGEWSLEDRMNKSLIMKEYIDRVRWGGLGYAVLFQLANTDRVVSKDRTIRGDTAARRAVRDLVWNKRDRTFAHVAWHTDSRLLVSHDLKDFALERRPDIKRRVGVEVVMANQVAF